MQLPFLHVRSRLAWVIGEIILALALAGLITWLSYAIQDKRRQIAAFEAQVDQQLAGAGEGAALKTAIGERQTDLTALQSYVPTEDAIGELVAVLESEAAKRGLTLQIPVVEEAVAEDEQAESTDSAAVLKDVRFSVIVTGPARPVLQFFHAVEHLPYLTRVGEWKFLVDQSGVVPGAGLSAPASVPGGTVASVPVTQATVTELTLDLYLAVHTSVAP